jgi:hypothetical protein
MSSSMGREAVGIEVTMYVPISAGSCGGAHASLPHVADDLRISAAGFSRNRPSSRTRPLSACRRDRLSAVGVHRLSWPGAARPAETGRSSGFDALHWLLLSIAAWWAALELIYAPFRWRKTEHGLDKASRQKSNTRSLLELERLLVDLKRRGELAQIRDYR